MINRLYREAAERTGAAADTFSDGYDEFDTIGSPEVDELSNRGKIIKLRYAYDQEKDLLKLGRCQVKLVSHLWACQAS